jgi:hypothetical protein
MNNVTAKDFHHLPFEVLKKIELDSRDPVNEQTTNLGTIHPNLCNQNKTRNRVNYRALNALKCNKSRNRFAYGFNWYFVVVKNKKILFLITF